HGSATIRNTDCDIAALIVCLPRSRQEPSMSLCSGIYDASRKGHCDTFKPGNKLLVFGNGGSSADAQHICGELLGRFVKERTGLPALALCANQAVVTAWSNDYSFESVFARQVEALGRHGDVAWGISTSGNSP